MKFERLKEKTKDDQEEIEKQPIYLELDADEDTVYNEIDEPRGDLVGIFRINSKTVYVLLTLNVKYFM